MQPAIVYSIVWAKIFWSATKAKSNEIWEFQGARIVSSVEQFFGGATQANWQFMYI